MILGLNARPSGTEFSLSRHRLVRRDVNVDAGKRDIFLGHARVIDSGAHIMFGIAVGSTTAESVTSPSASSTRAIISSAISPAKPLMMFRSQTSSP